MTFILIVHDEIAKDHIGEYEFDTLKEAKEFALDLITIDERNGKNYSYVVIDSENNNYNLYN
ncbi:hypothetical protein [Desulfosporosinus sp. BICA1-9]|uniref:hypothetical protein n=1 Tax=Desulfosporosinus sp. BICA1-9 TaxID=1531958 RepID=UPI00054B0177|nr:hypothetical protein [Desulfosporosinus sp. BICA1-9]KJS49343.1 MAG: hypothetical protein VR66_09150 [Peptococcaceae bacterium BRH_c23]KJS80710.1 MAG: hypothetical protein JL57_27700 [Desulfosporosinus sp. BICA1-9]HBW35653.1 hypothetical protein [Desulfosporosinus sp.]